LHYRLLCVEGYSDKQHVKGKEKEELFWNFSSQAAYMYFKGHWTYFTDSCGQIVCTGIESLNG
jgi:hypothetical protein